MNKKTKLLLEELAKDVVEENGINPTALSRFDKAIKRYRNSGYEVAIFEGVSRVYHEIIELDRRKLV